MPQVIAANPGFASLGADVRIKDIAEEGFIFLILLVH